MSEIQVPAESALAEKIVALLRQEGANDRTAYAALAQAAINVNGIGELLSFVRWARLFALAKEL